MDAFGWPELVALLTSIGFGIVSAIVPIVNAEAYVIASQMSAAIGPFRSRLASPSAKPLASCCSFSAYAKARTALRQASPGAPETAPHRADPGALPRCDGKAA